MTHPELNDRVVLITGTNNNEGIGQAIAREFAAHGARLLLTYRPVFPGSRPASPPPDPGDARYAWLNEVDPLNLLECLQADGLEVEARPFDHALADSAEAEEKDVLKGTRWLLLKNPGGLDEEKDEAQRLKAALELNAPLAAVII